jgi:hypothetical protein
MRKNPLWRTLAIQGPYAPKRILSIILKRKPGQPIYTPPLAYPITCPNMIWMIFIAETGVSGLKSGKLSALGRSYLKQGTFRSIYIHVVYIP